MLRAGQLLADIEMEEETALAGPGHRSAGEVSA
jgi:hypothetical protein